MWGILFMLLGVPSAETASSPMLEENVIKTSLFAPKNVSEKSYLLSSRPVLYKDESVAITPEIVDLVSDKQNFVLGTHFNPEVPLKHFIKDPVLKRHGIKEVLSLGVSDFSGSSSNRLKNINIALQKFDGIVVPQGEIFSFNEILESVEASEGYVKEKVVLGGKGAYALGGGICQLSSTIYRAALNAGLPITERRNHTYAYNKYLPYGLDATIYLGVQDLVFTNDTPGDLLIKPYIKNNQLLVAFYGTDDDRTVKTRRTVYRRPYSGGVVTNWEREVARGDVVEIDEIYSHYKAIY